MKMRILFLAGALMLSQNLGAMLVEPLAGSDTSPASGKLVSGSGAVELGADGQGAGDDESACSLYCRGCESCLRNLINPPVRAIPGDSQSASQGARVPKETAGHEDLDDKSNMQKLSKFFRGSNFSRLCRNAVEVASIPELYHQVVLCKDIILGVGACASESILAFAPAACSLSGGFLIFSLADLGLTIYDLWNVPVDLQKKRADMEKR